MPWPKGGGRRRPLPPNWNRIRIQVLARDRTCRACKQRPSTEVDHVVPSGPDTADNLQGLCKRCHQSKSAREGNEQKLFNRWGEPHPGWGGNPWRPARTSSA